MVIVNKFLDVSPYAAIERDQEAIKAMVLACITSGFLVFNGSGMLAALPVPLFINTDIIVAQELAWFAPEGGGREMREMFEKWCEDNDIQVTKFSIMAGPNFDKALANLTTNGYSFIEAALIKVS